MSKKFPKPNNLDRFLIFVAVVLVIAIAVVVIANTQQPIS